MNICIMKSPKEKIERERGRKPVKEIIAENFLSLRRDMELQIYEAKVPPSKISTKKGYPEAHLNQIIKSQSLNFESSKRKETHYIQITLPPCSIRLLADFLARILKARRQWDGILKVLKENKQTHFHLTVLYCLVKLTFRNGEIKTFSKKSWSSFDWTCFIRSAQMTPPLWQKVKRN